MLQDNQTINMRPIGVIRGKQGAFALQLNPGYAPTLQGIEGFSHLLVLWWANGCPGGGPLAVPAPYRTAPGTLGLFATRSPARPNPICLSAAAVTGVDHAAGVVHLAWLDADDGTPILDIKPYTPSLDRVESPAVPGWCAHWPASLEASAAFDWEGEFTLGD